MCWPASRAAARSISPATAQAGLFVWLIHGGSISFWRASYRDARPTVPIIGRAGCLRTDPALVHVEVTGDMVRMTGQIQRKSMLPLVLPMVRATDGVIDRR